MTTSPEQIQVYSDESKEGIHIDAFIWGATTQIDSFRSVTAGEIDSFREAHGAGFNGFHGVKIKAKNWTNYEPHLEAIFGALASALDQGLLGSALIGEASSHRNETVTKFREWLKTELETEKSPVKSVLASLKEDDFPVVYHRFAQFVPFFAIRGSAFADIDSVDWYPDSIGKWLHFADETRSVTSSFGIAGEIPFFDVVKIVGQSFANFLTNAKHIRPGARIALLNPKKDEEEPLLQACDLLSNSFLAFARTRAGSTEPADLFKADLLTKHFPSLSVDGLQNALSWDEGKLESKNDNFVAVVNLSEMI